MSGDDCQTLGRGTEAAESLKASLHWHPDSVSSIAHDRIRIFGFVLALALALAYLTFRLGFPLHIEEVALALSFYVFVVFSPPLGWRLLRKSPPKYPSDLILLSVAAMAVAVALSWLGATGRYAYFAASAAALLYFFFRLFRVFTLWSIASTLLTAALTGALIAVFTFSFEIGPTMREALFFDRAGADPLYHLAITQMAKYFGVPSTGFNGTDLVHYHTGSHFLIGRMSRLFDADAVGIYGTISSIFVIPFLIAASATAMLDICRIRDAECSPRWSIAVLFVVAALVVHAVLDRAVIFSNPSYPLALILVVSALPRFCAAVGSIGARGAESGALLPAGFVVMVFLLPLIAWMKTVTAIVALIVWGFAYFRYRNSLRAGFLYGLVLAALLAATFHLFMPSNIEGRFQIVFGQYLWEEYVKESELPFYPLLVFFSKNAFVIALLWVALRQHRMTSLGQFWGGVKERRLVGVEAVVLGAIAAAMPELFTGGGEPDPGIAYYYASNAVSWLAALLLFAYLAEPQPEAARALPDGATGAVVRRWGAAAIVLIAISYTTVEYHLAHHWKSAVARAVEIRKTVFGAGYSVNPISSDAFRRSIMENSFSDGYSAPQLERDNNVYRITGALRSLRNEYGDRIAAYLERDVLYAFSKIDCQFALLYAPALAAVPNITPPSRNCPYSLRFAKADDEVDKFPSEDAEICSRAHARGFDVVYRIASTERLQDNRVITCPR